MLRFPSISPDYGFAFGEDWPAVVTEFSNFRRQVKYQTKHGLRHLQMRIPTITWDTSAELRNFYEQARRDKFEIFMPHRQKIVDFPVGVGDGVSGTFYAPFFYTTGDESVDGPSSEVLGVKVAGVAYHESGVSEPEAFTWSGRTAPYNDVEVQFFVLSPVPVVGAAITATILGRELVVMALDGPLQQEHPQSVPARRPYPADHYVLSMTEVPTE